jgi:hypothetical protein
MIGGSALAADLPAKAVVKKAPPPPPPFFLVNENSMSESYAFRATNPGTGVTGKIVSNFTHFDVWAYGTNFFTIDWLKATSAATPAAPCDRGTASNPVGQSCAGYSEIYGLFRSTIGWNQLSHSKNFAMGPLTNIEFAWGSDWNTDNTTLGSQKFSYQGGLQFDFMAYHKGFINIGLYAYKEHQNDGFSALGLCTGGIYGPCNTTGRQDFDTTWKIETLWVQPLDFLPEWLPVTFKSLDIIQGPKGAGETGEPKRITEYLTQQTLSLDVGKIFMGTPDMVSTWVAYRYWKNKFGIDAATFGFAPNTVTESTALVGVTVAF